MTLFDSGEISRPPKQFTDEQWIELQQECLRVAFTVLKRKRLLHRYSHDGLSQELTARFVAEYRNREPPHRWKVLMDLARRIVKCRLQEDDRKRPLQDASTDHFSEIEARDEWESCCARLEEAIQHLTPREAEIWSKYIDQLQRGDGTLKGLAKALGIEDSTLYASLSRIRAKLRGLLS